MNGQHFQEMTWALGNFQISCDFFLINNFVVLLLLFTKKEIGACLLHWSGWSQTPELQRSAHLGLAGITGLQVGATVPGQSCDFLVPTF